MLLEFPPFAIFIAWLLARKDFYGKSLITGLIHLPLGATASRNRSYLLPGSGGRNGFIGKHLHQMVWFYLILPLEASVALVCTPSS